MVGDGSLEAAAMAAHLQFHPFRFNLKIPRCFFFFNKNRSFLQSTRYPEHEFGILQFLILEFIFSGVLGVCWIAAGFFAECRGFV
ncbi:uncharacterized protein [Spinacia oleracea]|uniref:Uncharacterized protein isoform X2 n=1 Tax=Spinacia oleracea TaxID=3562 RepID=A0ABM3QWR5_SPIOL|nr:uncharacterized protein LOC130462860 isoform X2 [Spinacia oleracea]